MWAKTSTLLWLQRKWPSIVPGYRGFPIRAHSVQGLVALRYNGSSTKSKPLNPILRFFAAYPSFDYNPGLRPYSSHTSEFNRLCEVMEWGKKGRRRKAARKEFQEALVRWFNEAYGVDAECLEAWQELCKDSRIHPVPGTLVKARKVRPNFWQLDLVLVLKIAFLT
jgi:hypothetical protein